MCEMDAVNVMKLNVSVSDANEAAIFEGAKEILKSLRPEWHQDDISYKMLTDGITNKLVRCKVKGCDDREAVLIRIYGNKTDLLIDRKAETRNIQMLNRFNLAPTLYATFTNGLAYEFVPGCTLTTKTVRQPEIYRLVARQMARLHKINCDDASSEGSPQRSAALWKKIESFLELVPEVFTKEAVNRKFLDLRISKGELQSEVATLKLHLSKLQSPIVFCHNDLLLGNVIYSTPDARANSSEESKVCFIDFEYADWNYQAYDIGNHFAEFAGIENVDYNNYPSKELQYAWLKEYAEEFSASCEDKMNIDLLYVQVNQFALASHLLWGIWALIQAEHSYLEFDFIEFASVRIAEYFRRKDEFLHLTFNK